MGLARPKDSGTALMPIGPAPSIGVADEMAVVSIAGLFGGVPGAGQAVPGEIPSAATIGPHGFIHELVAEAAVTGPAVSVLRLEDLLDLTGHGELRLPLVDQALANTAIVTGPVDLHLPNDIREAVNDQASMTMGNSPAVLAADSWFSTLAYVSTGHDHVMAFLGEDALVPAGHAWNDRILIDLPPIDDNHLIA